VVGISAECLVLPCVVRRCRIRASPAAERFDPPVAHAGRAQRCLERGGAELRETSRAGEPTNIDDRLDLVRGEHGEQLVGRARGVPDRPDSHCEDDESPATANSDNGSTVTRP
jgi:hypothetical protein